MKRDGSKDYVGSLCEGGVNSISLSPGYWTDAVTMQLIMEITNVERHANNKPKMTARNLMVFCRFYLFVTSNGMPNAVNVSSELSDIR